MIYTYYDKIYTVPGTGRAPPGLPGPRAPPAWYQALPEQAQKACLLGALLSQEVKITLATKLGQPVTGLTFGCIVRFAHLLLTIFPFC
jgi:hypothetical protein